MTLYHPKRGDMPRNLLARIERQLAHHPFLRVAFGRLKRTLQEEPNLLRRLAAYNDRFWA